VITCAFRHMVSNFLRMLSLPSIVRTKVSGMESMALCESQPNLSSVLEGDDAVVAINRLNVGLFADKTFNTLKAEDMLIEATINTINIYILLRFRQFYREINEIFGFDLWRRVDCNLAKSRLLTLTFPYPPL
jgi:hypothetical protein